MNVPKSETSRNGIRQYRSPVREAAARETRRRVVEAAARCFTAFGYSATTLRAIAAEAGVSVETVNGLGPKRDLLFAAFETAFLGEEGQSSMASRPDFAAVLDAGDAPAFVRDLTHALTDAFERGTGIWRAVTAAADVDASVRASHDEIVLRRRGDFTTALEQLRLRGAADDVDVEHTVDVLSLLASPESYHHLVVVCGWSREAYEAWLTDSVMREISPPRG